MVQSAVVRDHTSLSIEKRRSNRTVYVLSRALEDLNRIAGTEGRFLRPHAR